MRLKDDIIGKEVLDSSATVIGNVKDVEVNLETRKIEALVLGKGGLSEGLGLSKGETIVPYDMVKQIGDKILLKSSIEEESSMEF